MGRSQNQRGLDRPTSTADDLFIGVLDISGFANFDFNSFEQLCINYTNEKIQQIFENHVANSKKEKRAQEEGFTEIPSNKSTLVVDLIGKVMYTLDEMTAIRAGRSDRDKFFTSKINQQFGGRHPNFASSSSGGDFEFAIEHYAGRVTYNTQGWTYNNNHHLDFEVRTTIGSSKNKSLANLFAFLDSRSPSPGPTSRGSRSKVHSGVYLFKEQLTSLVDTIQSTTPHFVRCILTNRQKIPRTINDTVVLDQFNCDGVLESLQA